jgi:hypothetical protein
MKAIELMVDVVFLLSIAAVLVGCWMSGTPAGLVGTGLVGVFAAVTIASGRAGAKPKHKKG